MRLATARREEGEGRGRERGRAGKRIREEKGKQEIVEVLYKGRFASDI